MRPAGVEWGEREAEKPNNGGNSKERGVEREDVEGEIATELRFMTDQNWSLPVRSPASWVPALPLIQRSKYGILHKFHTKTLP